MNAPAPSGGTCAQEFLRLARSRPRTLFARLLFPDAPGLDVTYGELLAEASRYANFLAARGVAKGQVVILLLPHGPELLTSFVGTVLRGAVPSIFAPPSPKTAPEEYREMLVQLLDVCATRTLVASDELAARLVGGGMIADGLQVLASHEYRGFSPAFDPPEAAPDDIVLLQHSSGTTGLKKGVALSNRSVLRQLDNYASTLGLRAEDRIASWLPLYHDMGLIACFVLPLLRAVPVVMMSPFDWVADPASLLHAIHRERATLCWQPNFAYNLLATRVQDAQVEGLDLGSMRAFINCSEPISAESHDLFFGRFQRYGLRREALCTCYAMAENTFAVTQGGILEPVKVEEVDARAFLTEHRALPALPLTESRRRVVSSGRAIPGNEVRVVDPRGHPLPEGHVGEIVVRSDSMLSEYYHRPDATREALRGGAYHTGDLGYLSGGHLFVTGRKKDMIIVAGKNVYPQDIEALASSVDGVHPGRTVAFGVYSEQAGTEEVVILAETSVADPSRRMGIKLAIARAVRAQLECVASDILLLPHMRLVKSSAGKISRNRNRERYLREWRAGKHGDGSR